MGRRKKHDHGGHHGGSWKVAYADFVTAMMAFFLLMWLLSMTSEQQKVGLSDYFKYFNLFDKGGASSIGLEPMKPFDQFTVVEGSMKTEDRPTTGDADPDAAAGIAKERIQELLAKSIEANLEDVREQILVDAIPEGVRIQLVDTDGYLLFPVGSSYLSAKTRDILRVITGVIRNVPAQVVIEGHTDSRPYPSQEFTNWELSADRANAARRIMVQDGLRAENLLRVTGNADRNPLIPDDLMDARNRRISILLFLREKRATSPFPDPIPYLIPH